MCGPGLRRNGQDEDFSGDFLEVTSPHSCKAADLNNAQRALTPPTITVDFVLGKTGNRIAVALARETVAAARL